MKDSCNVFVLNIYVYLGNLFFCSYLKKLLLFSLLNILSFQIKNIVYYQV